MLSKTHRLQHEVILRIVRHFAESQFELDMIFDMLFIKDNT